MKDSIKNGRTSLAIDRCRKTSCPSSSKKPAFVTGVGTAVALAPLAL